MSTPIYTLGGTDKGAVEFAAAAASAWTTIQIGDCTSRVTGSALTGSKVVDLTIWNRDASATIWIAYRAMTDEALSLDSGAAPIGPGNSLTDTVLGCNVTEIALASSTEGALAAVLLSTVAGGGT